MENTIVRTLRVKSITWESWTSGAHIALCVSPGSIRQYSLIGACEDCSSYRIDVHWGPDEHGGSDKVNSPALTVGWELEIRGPMNHFGLDPAECYIFLAGAIGIMLIISMVMEARRNRSSWHLIYGGGPIEPKALADELPKSDIGEVRLAPQNPQWYSDLGTVITTAAGDTMFSCWGSAGGLAVVGQCCRHRSMVDRLHFWRFAAPILTDIGNSYGCGEGCEFEVELRKSGFFPAASKDNAHFQAIREVLPGVLSLCEEGYRGTYEKAVLAGKPDPRNSILTESEREATRW